MDTQRSLDTHDVYMLIKLSSLLKEAQGQTTTPKIDPMTLPHSKMTGAIYAGLKRPQQQKYMDYIEKTLGGGEGFSSWHEKMLKDPTYYKQTEERKARSRMKVLGGHGLTPDEASNLRREKTRRAYVDTGLKYLYGGERPSSIAESYAATLVPGYHQAKQFLGVSKDYGRLRKALTSPGRHLSNIEQANKDVTTAFQKAKASPQRTQQKQLAAQRGIEKGYQEAVEAEMKTGVKPGKHPSIAPEQETYASDPTGTYKKMKDDPANWWDHLSKFITTSLMGQQGFQKHVTPMNILMSLMGIMALRRMLR